MKRFIPFLLFAAALLCGSPPSLAQGQSAAHGSLTSGGVPCITTGATPNCLVLTVNSNIGGVGLSIGTAIFSGTVQFEAAGDPARALFHSLAVTPAAGGAQVTSATATGLWFAQCAGCTAIRIRVSTFVSGTIVADIQPSTVAFIAPSSGGGTPGGSNTQVQFDDNGSFGGAPNILFAKASGVFSANQAANGNDTIYGSRFTDSSPTGSLIHFQNAAKSADLFNLGANGNITWGDGPLGSNNIISNAFQFAITPDGGDGEGAVLINIAPSTGYFRIGGGTINSTQFNAFGSLTYYRNIATVANGQAVEYAAANLTAQTAAITTTSLYSPTATGWFRIEVYAKVTTPDGASSTLGGASGLTIGYTDGTDSVAQTTVAQLATQAGAAAINNNGNTTATKLLGHVDVYALTGVPITYAFGYTSGTPGTMAYELRLVLESL